MELQAASYDIYLQKYALRDKNSQLLDLSIDETYDRVSSALSNIEDDKKQWKRKFRDVLEYAIPAGRIMSNAGSIDYKNNVSLINCLVSDTIQDSMDSILSKLYESGLSLKSGCGIGYCFSHLRPKNSFVNGPGTTTSGPLSFMDIYDSMCKTISSAGGRRGAQMATMHVTHPDIMEFVTAKQDLKRLRYFNLSVLITDEFINAVKNNDPWNLIWNNKIHSTINAQELWNVIMESNYNYAEPGFILIDRINKFNNLWFCEDIEATNPCGEQPLPPNGACLLGSLNLTKFVNNPFTENSYFDFNKFTSIVRDFTRMLDNVVELSNLPLKQQQNEIFTKRRHGMGFMGLGSVFTMLRMKYGSEESIKLTDEITKKLAFEGISTGIELAKEKGEAEVLCKKYLFSEKMKLKNSNTNDFKIGKEYSGRDLWIQSHYFDAWKETNEGNEILKEAQRYGCRFSHHTTIPPTGTTALSFGNNCSSGIEPSFTHSYTRNIIIPGKMAKEAIPVYSYEYLLYNKIFGNTKVSELPDYFTTTDSLTPNQHIDIQSVAQKWVDSSISKTVNVPTDIKYEDFCNVYLYAYEKGLKGCTTFRYNPEVFQGVIVKNEDLEKTYYKFILENGRNVIVKGSDKIEYEGDIFSAANLADSIKDGTWGKL